LVAHQAHAMDMDDLSAKTSKETDKKERSCATVCCDLTKGLCGVAAAYYVLTAGQTGVVLRGQPTETVIVSAPCPYKLEPGYAAASWSDLRNRKQYEQPACTMDDDAQGTVGVDKSLEKYKDYII